MIKLENDLNLSNKINTKHSQDFTSTPQQELAGKTLNEAFKIFILSLYVKERKKLLLIDYCPNVSIALKVNQLSTNASALRHRGASYT